MKRLDAIKKICKKGHSEKDYDYHILQVVKYALLLAKKLNADLEVVEVAAYLHDIGRADNRKDFVNNERQFLGDNNHHIVGAKESVSILQDLGYDKKFIKKVEHCVLAHRGRKDPNPETLEAEIIACADAMSHFDTFLHLFSVFLKTTDSFEEAIIEIEKKMDRNWNKKLTLPESRAMIEDKYNAIVLLIKSMKVRMTK